MRSLVSVLKVLPLVCNPVFSSSSCVKSQALIMGATYSWLQKKFSSAEVQFPATLEDFGYYFNNEGQLRSIEGDREFVFNVKNGDHVYNQLHYQALGEVVTEKVYTMLEKQYKLQRTYLPISADSTEKRSFAFISGDLYTNTDKLLILVHGNGVVRAGQWSRKLIINDCLDHGTQFPFIRWGLENKYAVIVANPNLNTVEDSRGREHKIKGNGSPEEHLDTLWKDLVQRAPAKHVAIVAHSYGGVSTVELIKKYLREFETRVFAVAFTDSVHGFQRQNIEEEVADYCKQSIVNWASAYDPLDTPLMTNEDDVPTVSAGTDNHESTSYKSMASIFRYFEERYRELSEPERRRYIVGEHLKPATDSGSINQSAEDMVPRPDGQSTDKADGGGQSQDKEQTNQVKAEL